MTQFTLNSISEAYKTTIAADYRSKEVIIGGRTSSLQIWDTAGQERYKLMNAAFFQGADICILVFDVNDAKSFESLANWRELFLEIVPIEEHNTPMVVFGNKVDLLDSDKSRAVPREEVGAWAKSIGAPYFETSAKQRNSVEEAFRGIASQLEKKLDGENRDSREPMEGACIDVKGQMLVPDTNT